MSTVTGIANVPGRTGAGIWLDTIAELPNYSVDGLTIGTKIYVQETFSDWKLTVSTATVDHVAVEAVSGYTAFRWLKVLSLPDSWAKLRENEIRALPECATLNEFRSFTLGVQSPPGADFVADAAVEGGGVKPTAGAVTHSFLSNSIFQTCKTGHFAIEFRFEMSAPASTKFTEVGLASTGAAHEFTISSNADVDATKFYIRIAGAGTTNSSNQTVVNDALFHNGRLTGDGTTIRMYIDNVLAASTTTLTNLSDEPLGAYAFSSAGSSVIVTEFIYGFVNTAV